MGVGNFFLTNARTVKVMGCDLYEGIAEDDAFEHEIQFDDFKEDVRNVLPGSFDSVEDGAWLNNHARIIAENGFFNVTLAQWEGGDVYVSVALKENDDRYPGGINPLAEARLDSTADKIFDALSESWKLWVSTGPWTSGRYQPTNAMEMPDVPASNQTSESRPEPGM